MNQTVDFAKFIENALVTESPVPRVEVGKQFFSDVLELAVASAMLLDQVKKHIFYRAQDPSNPEEFLHRPLDAVKIGAYLNQTARAVQRLQQGGLAHELANPTSVALPVNTRLVHAVVGKFTESGEMLQALLGAMQENRTVDRVNLAEELGDDKWYDAIAMDELGLDMNQVLNTVTNKLRERYKDKFAAHEADNRNLNAERWILQAGAKSRDTP
jgi:NTP pyrophosphatase (non-canonical NTP hydrolase)